MPKKLTYDYIKEQIDKEGYQLLSDSYKNNHTKLQVRCPEGHEYEVTWNNFQQGHSCPECSENKLLTYDFVKEQIKSFEYTLLSKEYKNSRTKLKVRCPEGHEYEVTWNNFKNNMRCRECYNNHRGEKLKHSYEHVKEQIEKEGYQLLSDEYKNNNTKLKLKCPKGHEYEVVWSSFQQGCRCLECFGNKKLTYDFVKEQIEKEGYKLLSKEYKRAHGYLQVQCPKGHDYSVRWNNWNKGYRCSECAGNKLLTYDFVKEQIEKERYELLSKTYKNAFIKLKVRCPKGHEYRVTWNNFQIGKRCPRCKGGVRLTTKHIKEYIEKRGFELIYSDYKNKNSYLLIKCKEGHIARRKWSAFQQKPTCPQCSLEYKFSKAERLIVKDIKKRYKGKIICNDRTQIINPLTRYNLELDIWLPELNKAIEFNGIYWHDKPKIIKRDKIKKQQCLEKGIDLLIIHEEHWINNKEYCLEQIKQFVG